MSFYTNNHILMLLENNPYPEDTRVRKEAQTLTEAGYRVTVICPRQAGQNLHEVVNGVTAYRYPAPPEAERSLGYLWEYGYSLIATFILSLYLFWRHPFQVIHAHNPPDLFVFLALFYKPFGVKFVFDHHDLSPENYYARFRDGGKPFVYRLLVWCERLSCRLADHVIATNQSYKAIEMERSGVPENRITIVRNGPDLTRVRPVTPDAALRQKAATLIGFVGAMGPQDGLDYLLRALHHLVTDRQRTDFYCVLMGNGSEWQRLHDQAAALGIAEHVWFVGWVGADDLCRYLSTVDICVSADPHNAYNDRSTMIKLMEYMALSKPIVAFDLTEHRRTAGDAALYVPGNDEFAYAQALAVLMDDPARRRAMGQCGRQRIETALEWRYSAVALREAYSRVLPLQEEALPAHQ